MISILPTFFKSLIQPTHIIKILFELFHSGRGREYFYFIAEAAEPAVKLIADCAVATAR